MSDDDIPLGPDDEPDVETDNVYEFKKPNSNGHDKNALADLVRLTRENASAPYAQLDFLASLPVATFESFLIDISNTRVAGGKLRDIVTKCRNEAARKAKAEAKAAEDDASYLKMYSMGLHRVTASGEQFICGPFNIQAICRDDDFMEWGFRLAWRDPDGKVHAFFVPWSYLASDGVALCGELLRRGLRVCPNRNARADLMHYLDEQHEKQGAIPRGTLSQQPGGMGHNSFCLITPLESFRATRRSCKARSHSAINSISPGHWKSGSITLPSLPRAMII